MSQDSTCTAAREASSAAAASYSREQRAAACGVRDNVEIGIKWSGNKITISCQSEHHVIFEKLCRTPHTADLCCLLPEAAAAEKTPRTAVQCTSSFLTPCAHGKLHVKHHRTAPKEIYSQ